MAALLAAQEGNGLSLEMGPEWEADIGKGATDGTQRTPEVQEADMKVGVVGQLLSGQGTSGNVSSAPRGALRLLRDLLRPRTRRYCLVVFLLSARVPGPAAPTAC